MVVEEEGIIQGSVTHIHPNARINSEMEGKIGFGGEYGLIEGLKLSRKPSGRTDYTQRGKFGERSFTGRMVGYVEGKVDYIFEGEARETEAESKGVVTNFMNEKFVDVLEIPSGLRWVTPLEIRDEDRLEEVVERTDFLELYRRGDKIKTIIHSPHPGSNGSDGYRAISLFVDGVVAEYGKIEGEAMAFRTNGSLRRQDIGKLDEEFNLMDGVSIFRRDNGTIKKIRRKKVSEDGSESVTSETYDKGGILKGTTIESVGENYSQTVRVSGSGRRVVQVGVGGNEVSY